MAIAGIMCGLEGDYEDMILGIVLAVMFIGIPIVIFVGLDAASKEEKQKEKEQEQLELRLKDRSAIWEIVESAEKCFTNIYQRHSNAKKNLDRAEAYFNEGAYSPFWDTVENAASELGYFYQHLKELRNMLKDFKYRLRRFVDDHGEQSYYDDDFPVTPAQLEELYQLGRANELPKRMAGIVRTAQRDFHFASIFEQRKTRKSIVAGFESFEEALSDVGDQINSEVRSLNHEMTFMMEAATDQREQHHTEIIEADAERAEREEQALEMLEDISRRRK